MMTKRNRKQKQTVSKATVPVVDGRALVIGGLSVSRRTGESFVFLDRGRIIGEVFNERVKGAVAIYKIQAPPDITVLRREVLDRLILEHQQKGQGDHVDSNSRQQAAGGGRPEQGPAAQGSGIGGQGSGGESPNH